MKARLTLLALLATVITSNALAGSCPENLPNGLGYWKNHADIWPAEYVVVGNQSLGKAYIIDTIAEMRATTDGDAVIALLHQVIPAKINIEGGVDDAPVAQHIAQADSLLAIYWIGDDMDGATRAHMVELATVLDDFNNGEFCSLPVELTSFTARASDGMITLQWATAVETDNAGFGVEHRRNDSDTFEELAFVPGHGTTSQEASYGIDLFDLGYGTHAFRLRQVDLDGTTTYSGTIEVDVALAGSFALADAYPNPFNPTTNIRFSLREAGSITLGVYDITGRLVRTLANGSFPAGSHDVTFSAENLPSGTYVYRLQTEAGPVAGTIVLLK